jgi:hypothetical protein
MDESRIGLEIGIQLFQDAWLGFRVEVYGFLNSASYLISGLGTRTEQTPPVHTMEIKTVGA